MNILTQLDLTVDVYKAAGAIAGKRKQLEASEEGGKYRVLQFHMVTESSLSANSLLFRC